MKIAFLGAGSTMFAKNVIGDCILTPELKNFEVSLFDIDDQRLDDSCKILQNINESEGSPAIIHATMDRREALRNADFVVNAIQVGGYDPCTITDFEIPKKYGLRQTIGDTLGVGGIFRALRTIPVMDGIANDIMKVCPDAWFLNYVNPMAIITGYMQRFTGVKTVGLCHSVQACVPDLLKTFKMEDKLEGCRWKIAGINHQAWLLEIQDANGKDLYPEIKRKAGSKKGEYETQKDLVRLEMMKRFGYYITESSEHTSEYTPYFIKSKHPDLIERFNIPLDEYPRRCIEQISNWVKMRDGLVENKNIKHEKSVEFASFIIKSIYTGEPYKIHGNVINTGLIPNLPANACVEVPCLIDRTGMNPCFVGDLPEQCAALNRSNINVQLLTIEAARTHKKEYIYMAAMLDPHTGSELTMDEIRSMCDEMIEEHGNWLPRFH